MMLGSGHPRRSRRPTVRHRRSPFQPDHLTIGVFEMTLLRQNAIRLARVAGFSVALTVASGACSGSSASATRSGGSPGSGGLVGGGGVTSAGGTLGTGGSATSGGSTVTGGSAASGGA